LWREELHRMARESGNHPAWGYTHCVRVFRLACTLEAGLDEGVLLAAALCHDMGAWPRYREPGVDHAVRSRRVAAELLPGIGYPQQSLPVVLEAIEQHMFSAPPGTSTEAVVLRDADTLDFLGALGVARIISITGLDDWAPDIRRACDVLAGFVDSLPSTLVTRRAKEVGRERATYLARFLDGLREEAGGVERW